MAKRKTQDEYISEVCAVNPNIEVLGQYINSNTKILHRCKMDGYEWDAYPTHVLRGHGCPLCAGYGVFVGYNDIATKRPDLIKYFKTKDDAQMFTEHSNKYADLICPCCGYQKHMLVGHLSKTGFACPVCGDGVSYPNKFFRALLSQIDNLNVKHEYQPDWAKPYFYDSYFELNGKQYIVEIDGIQHFTENNFGRSTLDEIKRVDDIKKNLAISHNVIMIRIDCRKSALGYIKSNILNSQLSQIFDLSCIDWLACEQNARTSLLEQVCTFYNTSENKQLKYIAEQLDLSTVTVRRYLHRGTNIGICNYKGPPRQLGVDAYNINDGNTFSFSSVSMCCRELSKLYNIKIEQKGVKRSCINKNKIYKGFIFKYKDGAIYE